MKVLIVGYNTDFTKQLTRILMASGGKKMLMLM